MRITKKGSLFIFLIIQVICINILKHFPQFIETVYSNFIYVFLSKLMRYTFGWIPFSVGDILYLIAIIYLIRWLILNFKRIYKDTLNWFLDVTACISVAYFAFHLLWGFNYYRQPLYKTLDINAKYTTEELIEFTERLIKKSNAIQLQISASDTLKVSFPYSKKDIFNKVNSGFNNLALKHPNLTYKPNSIKASLFSLPLTYMGFSGYLNPFTNEAQVDDLIPTYKHPTTSCHEIAHQLGYAAENEANFIGALSAIYNDDIYFKYSGYTFVLRYCLSEIYRRDQEKHSQLLKKIHKGVFKNYKDAQDFWLAYQNPIEPYFKTTFDTFLKANNQSSGIKSYSYIVALMVNYYANKPL